MKEQSVKDPMGKVTEEKFDKDFKGKKKWGNKKSKGFKGKKHNDDSWHGRNSQLVKDFGSIPFNHMMGFPFTIGNSTFTPSDTKVSLASIKSFFHDWFAGISDDFRSILNQAATNMWTLIRSRNSGATNYQSADIFINIILGCLDIFATITFITRFFLMKVMYSDRNRTIPRVLFQAMGLDYDDFIQNIANYRGRFNIILAKASSLLIPKQFTLYDFSMCYYKDVFKDRDSDTGREQLYIVGKKYFHIYDPVYNSQGGGVRLMKIGDLPGQSSNPNKDATLTICDYKNGSYAGGYMKMSELLDILDRQVDAIVTDEDCNIIMGDIRKCYGDSASGYWGINPLTEDMNIDPVYSEEFLVQLHNSVVLPENLTAFDATSGYYFDPYTGSQLAAQPSNDVFQDGNGNLITKFSYHVAKSLFTNPPVQTTYNGNLILDSNENQPEPIKVVVMTRLHNRFKVETKTIGGVDFMEYTPIAVSAAILFSGRTYICDIASNMWKNIKYNQIMDLGDTAADLFEDIARDSNFDWAPVRYLVTPATTSPTTNPPARVMICGDINNVRSVDIDTIENLHKEDFTSLLSVPFNKAF